MKKVAKWQLHNENNKGMFKCRLTNQTKNSKRFQGTTAKGIAYDYHAYLSSEISGKLVWIDHVKGKFGNRFTLTLEQEKGIHTLEMDVSSSNLSNVVGCLLNCDFTNEYFNLSYAIMPSKDKMGNQIFDSAGKQKFNKRIFIKSNGNTIKSIYSVENPKPENIKWTQNAKGEWDDSKEIIFWTNHIANIQTELVENDIAIPFSIDSYVFTQISNPFYKLVDSDVVMKGTELYKKKRPTFQFLYEVSKANNADSVFEEEEIKVDDFKQKEVFTKEEEEIDDLPF